MYLSTVIRTNGRHVYLGVYPARAEAEAKAKRIVDLGKRRGVYFIAETRPVPVRLRREATIIAAARAYKASYDALCEAHETREGQAWFDAMTELGLARQDAEDALFSALEEEA